MTEKKNLRNTSASHGDIIIRQKGDIMQLLFASQPDAIQSAINRQQPEHLVMANLQYLMGILLFIPQPEKILLLGVGAGSLIHFFRRYLPESHLTAVDKDQQIIDIAQTHMLLPDADNNLEYVISDARQTINQCQQQYDLIVVDIFNGNQSPDWIRGRIFTQQIKACLTDRGAVAYNMLINSETVFKSFYRLLRQTFAGQTLCLETLAYENLLLYALNFKPEKRSMMKNIEHARQTRIKYPLPFSQILSVIYDINPVDSGII